MLVSSRNGLIADFLMLLFVGAGCASSGDGASQFRKKWIVVPEASFSAGRLDPAWPACPTADYPLDCPGDAGCCQEGYPFACPEQKRCYAQPPASQCPGFLTCVPVKLIITKIEPSDSLLQDGQSVTVTVEYKDFAGIGVTDLVIQAGGIDGRFEKPLAANQPSGSVSTTLTIRAEQPTRDSCLLACSRDGSCGPCFVSDDLFDAWKIDFALRDAGGELWGTTLDSLHLEVDSGGGSAGGICNDGSECCTTRPDCGGGIGCTVDGITTPEECDCPPNTTYVGHDIHFHLNQCDCNDC